MTKLFPGSSSECKKSHATIPLAVSVTAEGT